MAVASSSASKPASSAAKEDKETKRNKCPGVRVIGGRIYDSENGKTCHQCRQKTRDFSASCKNQKGDKQCTIKFCHKCLSNRYGERAEDMVLLDDWKCPKCRGICNCSFCMKKRGHKPTGQLFFTAKATGFSSVSEMLQIKGHDNLSCEKKIAKDMVLPKKPISPKKESVPASLRKPGKENSFDGNCDSNLNLQNSTAITNKKKSKRKKREGLKEICNSNGDDDDVSLRKRTPKKPKISEEIANKENSKIYEETSEKEKLEGSKEISKIKKPEFFEKIDKKEVETSEIDGGKKTSRTPKLSEEIAKKEKLKVSEKISKIRKSKISDRILKKEVDTNKNDGGDSVDKEICMTQILKNDTLNLISADDASHENVRVPTGIENDNAGPKLKAASDSCKIKKCPTELRNKDLAADIKLPQRASLTTVAGIEIAPEDIGHALQFLEFCSAFGKVLGLKKGQAECIVKELICGRSRRRGQYFPIVQIHIQLLSLLQKDMGEKSTSLSSTSGKNSWLQALRKCVSESKYVLNDISSDCINDSDDGYDKLDSSKKLKLLNFLCDEALGTTSLRNWIDDQNSKFVERVKETKENVVAAKDKEKCLKQKLQDEVAKAIIAKNGASLSISEHEVIVSQIKSEAAQAHSEMLEAMGMVPKKRQRPDAVRTEPILLEDNGHATCVFWRLKGYSGESDILLQDLEGNLDAVSLSEKWFGYGVDQKPAIEKYVSLIRAKKPRVQNITDNYNLEFGDKR